MDKAKLKQQAHKKYGQMLFGYNPELAKLQGRKGKSRRTASSDLDNKKYMSGSGLEWNTKKEHELYILLTRFIEGEYEHSDKVELAKKLKELQKYKQFFPKVLTVPKKTLYRGSAVSETIINKFLPKFKKSNSNNHREEFYADIIYKPKSPVQSWSLKMLVAYEFDGHSEYAVIFETKTDSSFVFSHNITQHFAHGNYSYENEVIRAGKAIACKMWIDGDVLLNYIDDMSRWKQEELFNKNSLFKHYFEKDSYGDYNRIN